MVAQVLYGCVFLQRTGKVIRYSSILVCFDQQIGVSQRSATLGCTGCVQLRWHWVAHHPGRHLDLHYIELVELDEEAMDVRIVLVKQFILPPAVVKKHRTLPGFQSKTGQYVI